MTRRTTRRRGSRTSASRCCYLVPRPSSCWKASCAVCRCPFLDVAAMSPYFRENDGVIVSWSQDRASENGRTMQYVLEEFEAKLPQTVTAHVEPCNCHGVHLSKGRSPEGKTVCATLNSFSRFTRDHAAKSALRRHVMLQVTTETVVVVRGSRPAGHEEWTKTIIECLFGDVEDAKFLWRVRNGVRVKSRFLQDLEAMLSVVDVDGLQAYYARKRQDVPPTFIHWCAVTSEMVAAGDARPVGSPCCSTPQESVDSGEGRPMGFRPLLASRL